MNIFVYHDVPAISPSTINMITDQCVRCIDYLVRVAVRDLNEFERFLTGRLNKVVGIASLESAIPIRRVKNAVNRLR